MTDTGRINGELKELKLIVIACEDHLSGRIYFEKLKEQCEIKSSHIKVEVLKRPKGKESCSAPNHQLENIQNFNEKYNLRDDDEIWLVSDFDRFEPNIRNTQEKVLELDYKVDICVSKPNFELWIYLHVRDLPTDEHAEITKMQKDPKYFENELKKLDGGYNKGNPKYERFFPKTKEACERARMLDPKNAQCEVLPDLKYFTRVYKIVDSLKFYKEYFEDKHKPQRKLSGFQR